MFIKILLNFIVSFYITYFLSNASLIFWIQNYIFYLLFIFHEILREKFFLNSTPLTSVKMYKLDTSIYLYLFSLILSFTLLFSARYKCRVISVFPWPSESSAFSCHPVVPRRSSFSGQKLGSRTMETGEVGGHACAR